MKLLAIKSKAIILLSLFSVSFFMSPLTYAQRFTPEDAHTLIASWPIITTPELQQAQNAKRLKPNDPVAVATLANNYLALAAMPGQSRLYGLAQAALKPLIDQNTDNIQVWLAWAQTLQHQHHFDEALEAIKKVVAQDPKNTNANLLAARIFLIQDKPAQARQACIQLLGSSDLLTTSACILEITSHDPQALIESYDQLATLVNREGLPSDERAPWLAQILADMSMRMNNPKVAEDWLTPQLTNATVNYLAQWASTQIAQQHYQKIIDVLTPLVTAAPEVDDLLLFQLALAEKNISNASTPQNWQSQLAARVALREQRQDSQHASEIANYYLDINPQPKQALKWAELHFQHSREENDKNLLARAQAAVAADMEATEPRSAP